MVIASSPGCNYGGAVLQMNTQLIWPHDSQPSCCEFERERDSLEAYCNGAEGTNLVLRGVEAQVQATQPLHQETAGFRSEQAVHRAAGIVWNLERSEFEDLFLTTLETPLRANNNDQPGRRRQQDTAELAEILGDSFRGVQQKKSGTLLLEAQSQCLAPTRLGDYRIESQLIGKSAPHFDQGGSQRQIDEV